MRVFHRLNHPSQQLLLALVTLFASSCAEKVATRPEALEACKKGCLSGVVADIPDEAKRTYCDENCACLIDFRFDATDKQKKSSKEEFMREVNQCVQQGQAKLDAQLSGQR